VEKISCSEADKNANPAKKLRYCLKINAIVAAASLAVMRQRSSDGIYRGCLAPGRAGGRCEAL